MTNSGGAVADNKSKIRAIILIVILIIVIAVVIILSLGTGENGGLWSRLEQVLWPGTYETEEESDDADDESLNEVVFMWTVTMIGNDDFVLLETGELPGNAEYADEFADEKVFVYRIEDRTDNSRTLLIGEPFSEAAYRLHLEWVDNQWKITAEENLW